VNVAGDRIRPDVPHEKTERFKDMKTKMALTVMALAVVCLSLAPALAVPCDANNKDRCNASLEKDGFGGAPGGAHDWMLLVDDATRDNFDNLTLNQIKELREEKTNELNNMTSAQIQELHNKQMDKLNNMTLAQIKELKMNGMGMMGDGMMNGRMGQGMMPQDGMNLGMDRGMAENGCCPGGRQ
jgi:hypothetical protein